MTGGPPLLNEARFNDRADDRAQPTCTAGGCACVKRRTTAVELTLHWPTTCVLLVGGLVGRVLLPSVPPPGSEMGRRAFAMSGGLLGEEPADFPFGPVGGVDHAEAGEVGVELRQALDDARARWCGLFRAVSAPPSIPSSS